MSRIVFCVSHVGFILSKYGGVVSKKSSKVEGDRFWDPPKVKNPNVKETTSTKIYYMQG